MQRLQWGIIATGRIAGAFARGLKTSNTGELAAVSSRDLKSAQGFAANHGANRAYGSHSELLADPEIDAVYIATPHPFHAALAIEAAAAGKHILCEKPLAMNMAEVTEVLAATEKHKVTLVEAYMYRCHPQTIKAVDLIRNGAIGQVGLVQANFGFHAPYNPEGRLFSKKLGGGAILDVGGYPASFACMVADAIGEASSVSVDTHGCLGTVDPQSGSDTLAICNLAFENGLAAQLSVSTQLSQQNQVRIYGSKGWIEIQTPWIVSPDGGDWQFTLQREGMDKPEIVRGSEPRGLYGIEADCFADLLTGNHSNSPCMSRSDTLRVNQILENWQKEIFG
ncbi:Gfo/Idh/MocA family protein [Pelagicoccus mobilis]|uniref:Gfo/Idh/MocA family oxidoreductase n=1 Tax=Pelagicoccus mobilis TaxID=415221 RepID=A0A934RVE7_9BACT|nr:Gfo/Idh/MocA family oxidoreductase [Pelagicoccus mobilis]MBK1877108.1 Gfo/Idh/MocA family oxidoreductase [Pelagicoccus mobilis]